MFGEDFSAAFDQIGYLTFRTWLLLISSFFLAQVLFVWAFWALLVLGRGPVIKAKLKDQDFEKSSYVAMAPATIPQRFINKAVILEFKVKGHKTYRLPSRVWRSDLNGILGRDEIALTQADQMWLRQRLKVSDDQPIPNTFRLKIKPVHITTPHFIYYQLWHPDATIRLAFRSAMLIVFISFAFSIFVEAIF